MTSTLAYEGLPAALELVKVTESIAQMRTQIVARSRIARAAVSRSLEASPNVTPTATASTTPTMTPNMTPNITPPSTPQRRFEALEAHIYAPPPLTPSVSSLDVAEAIDALGEGATEQAAMALANFAAEMGLSVAAASRR